MLNSLGGTRPKLSSSFICWEVVLSKLSNVTGLRCGSLGTLVMSLSSQPSMSAQASSPVDALWLTEVVCIGFPGQEFSFSCDLYLCKSSGEVLLWIFCSPSSCVTPTSSSHSSLAFSPSLASLTASRLAHSILVMSETT